MQSLCPGLSLLTSCVPGEGAAAEPAVPLRASWKKPHLMQLASKTHSAVLSLSPGCFLWVFLECFAFSGTLFFWYMIEVEK